MKSRGSAYPQRFGPYLLIQPLGSGGMGRVALAVTGDPGMETFCVVKRLLPHLRNDRELLARFRDEANLARRLSHGNLVATHAIGQVDGEPFLAQEFVEGHDLNDVRSRCSIERIPFPADLALYLVSQVARGLAYAHDFENLGLVHRDINPVNIRLSYAGEIKLLDFGLAISKLKTVMTEPGNGWWGKLAYMAPEQLSERPIDRRADLYVLGIVLWELLTRRPYGTTVEQGRMVLPQETREQAIARIREVDAIPPSMISSDVSPGLDRLVLKMLARNPDDRYQTAGELRAAVGEFLPATHDAESALAKLMARLYDVEHERSDRRELVLASTAPGEEASIQVSPALGNVTSAQPVGEPLERNGSEPSRAAHAQPQRRNIVLTAVATGLVVVVLGALAIKGRIAGTDRPEPATGASQTDLPHPADNVVTDPNPPQPPVAPQEKPAIVTVTEQPSGVALVPDKAHPIQSRRSPPARPVPQKAPAASAAELLDAASTAFERKDFSEAIKLGRRAVDAGGGSEARVLLGNAYALGQRPKDAEREYLQALKLTPSDPLLRARLEAVREQLHTEDKR